MSKKESRNTSPELANELAQSLQLLQTDRLLVPNAGDGAIIKAIQHIYPNAKIECTSNVASEIKNLEKLEHVNCIAGDFLELVQEDQDAFFESNFDVVVGHAPADSDDEIDFVISAFHCLKPGGTMLVVATPVWLNEKEEAVNYKGWLDKMNAYIEPVPQSIQAAAKMPGNCIIIRLDKDAATGSVFSREGKPADKTPQANGTEKKESLPIVPKKEFRSVRHDFTQEELQEYSMQLANATREVNTLEEEKKSVVSGYAARINESKATANKLSHMVVEGWEYRKVECSIVYHQPEKGKKQIIRNDTCAIVATESMTEYEWNLFNQPVEDGPDLLTV